MLAAQLNGKTDVFGNKLKLKQKPVAASAPMTALKRLMKLKFGQAGPGY